MAGFPTTVLDPFLAWFRGVAYPSAPTAVFVGLLTAAPSSNSGTGAVEVTTDAWTNYARVEIPCDTSHFSAPSGSNPRSIHNVDAIDFGSVSAVSPVTVKAMALFSASTAGTFLGWAPVPTGTRVFSNADAAVFPAGELVIAEGSYLSFGEVLTTNVSVPSKAAPTQGEFGSDLSLKTGFDMSTTTTADLIIKPPTSGTITKSLTSDNVIDAVTGTIRYLLAEGDLPDAGKYQGQIHDTTTGRSIYSGIFSFTVLAPLT